MPAEPLVYIVLVNWNGKEVTLDCLLSLSKVTYPDFRIVVVDNASSDGSVAAINTRFPDVRVLTMSSNLRFAGGNNAGMTSAISAGAELLLILNNDTTVAPDFLSMLVSRMQSDPRAGMVVPKIYYHGDPTRIWFAGGEVSYWTGTMKHTGIREVDRGQYDTSHEIEYATGCAILVRRSVVERVGMLDESFYIYGEDADWSRRVRLAGFTIVYEPSAKVWHKLSVATGGNLSLYKMRNKFISNFRFFARYASWFHWLVFPWANLLVNAGAAIKYILTSGKKR